MSNGDLLLDGLVILLSLWACWAKWGLPLWKRWYPRLSVCLPQLSLELVHPFALEAEPPDPDEEKEEEEEEEEFPSDWETDDEEVDDRPGYDDETVECGGTEDPDSVDRALAAATPAMQPRPFHLKLEASDPDIALRNALVVWHAWMLSHMASALHLIVIGQTGAGKTTVLQVFVESLILRRLPVVVCDPDAAAGDWPGAQVFGAGDDFKSITSAFKAVHTMAQERRQARAGGQREFDPFWLVLDEYADIKEECPQAGALVENALRRWRKLNMHIVIGVQDTQVRTMGFERRSSLLNHARIVTLRLGAEERRFASIDDGPPIGIPKLEPMRGPAQEQVLTSEEGAEWAVGPLDVDSAADIGIDPLEEGIEPDALFNCITDKDEQIRILLSQGRSYAEISSQLHVATTRISKVKKDFTLET